MRRISVFTIFFGCLGLGLAAGLAYAWLVAPARPADQTPARLNNTDRALYLRLVADSFAASGDRSIAAGRLAALGESSAADLMELITADLRNGDAGSNTTRLAALAAALQINDPTVDLLASTNPLPPATENPRQVPTIVAGTPESPAESPTYLLTDRLLTCAEGTPVRRIEVLVRDEDGQPQSGQTVTVSWEGGRDEFITGFSGGNDPGYADFVMEPSMAYSVAVATDDPLVTDLRVELCPDGSDGGWRLEFQVQGP